MHALRPLHDFSVDNIRLILPVLHGYVLHFDKGRVKGRLVTRLYFHSSSGRLYLHFSSESESPLQALSQHSNNKRHGSDLHSCRPSIIVEDFRLAVSAKSLHPFHILISKYKKYQVTFRLSLILLSSSSRNQSKSPCMRLKKYQTNIMYHRVFLNDNESD